MENSSKRNVTWNYIFTGILALLGIAGLVRGDWVSGAYILGAIGLLVWIWGSQRHRNDAVRIGLILAGVGIAILLFDMVREIAF